MKKRDRIKTSYGGKCAYCSTELDDKWQVDHKISKQYWPYSNTTGGVNDENNLVPVCRICNHYKRGKCIESSGHHIGYREYMLKFHIRLKKLPKHTDVSRTKRRIQYMQDIAIRYNIAVDRPWSGLFYMDTYPQH